MRGLISRGKHLKHVVHFGDQQVFPGATNYVCLLFLAQAGAEACRYVQANDLKRWLHNRTGMEGSCPADKIGREEWNFVVGHDSELFERLQAFPLRLANVASRIFQGLVTGADPVFILTRDSNGKFLSEATGQHHVFEEELLHPLCKGSLDIRKWRADVPPRSILFPYISIDGRALLIDENSFRSKYPKTWHYLLMNREKLESREGGKWRHEKWYAFGRSQNLNEMEQSKILTPSIAASASFTVDQGEHFYFVGSGAGGGGGYGITVAEGGTSRLKLIAALLNSPLLDYYLKKISSPFQGGYFAYNRQYIERLPMASCTPAQEEKIVLLVDYLLFLNGPTGKKVRQNSSAEPLLAGYLEQMLNGMVYELYFPNELHKRNIHLFEFLAQVRLPSIANINSQARLDRLHQLFETIYSVTHPIRKALDALSQVEMVRIIEGEA